MAQRLMTRVRELRLDLRLSQEAFAERAGLKYKHYQAIEAGRKPNIQLPTLVKMAEALDLELWELLKFDSNAAPISNSPQVTTKLHKRRAPKTS